MSEALALNLLVPNTMANCKNPQSKRLIHPQYRNRITPAKKRALKAAALAYDYNQATIAVQFGVSASRADELYWQGRYVLRHEFQHVAEALGSLEALLKLGATRKWNRFLDRVAPEPPEEWL